MNLFVVERERERKTGRGKGEERGKNVRKWMGKEKNEEGKEIEGDCEERGKVR